MSQPFLFPVHTLPHASAVPLALGVTRNKKRITIELQNLGDAQLCQEITAHIEHAFSDRTGEWCVSIAGSRAAENWDLRVEGPHGFERTYTLAGSTGQHEPEVISRLILQLVSPSFS